MNQPGCYEFVSGMSQKGSRVLLTEEVVNEYVQRSADGTGSFTNVTIYRGETPEEHRAKDRILEEVTLCALCCDDPRTFFDHVSMMLEKKCVREDYDERKWDELLHHMWISCSMSLTRLVLKERFHKSAKILLEMLQSRIKEWRKKSEGTVTRELDDEGNPTGGFKFVVEGGLL